MPPLTFTLHCALLSVLSPSPSSPQSLAVPFALLYIFFVLHFSFCLLPLLQLSSVILGVLIIALECLHAQTYFLFYFAAVFHFFYFAALLKYVIYFAFIAVGSLLRLQLLPLCLCFCFCFLPHSNAHTHTQTDAHTHLRWQMRNAPFLSGWSWNLYGFFFKGFLDKTSL